MNYGSSKSAKIVLSKSIFYVKNQPKFFKKKNHLLCTNLSESITSRTLTLSFAEFATSEVGQSARLSEPPSYVEQTRLCYLYYLLLSNSAAACT